METIINQLRMRGALCVDMVQALTRGTGEVIEASERGILVYHRGADVYLLDSASEEGAHALLAQCTHRADVVVREGVGAKSVEELWGNKETLDCVQGYYPLAQPPQGEDTCEIRALTLEHLPVVTTHYTHTDEEYVRKRLLAGAMRGAFDGNVLMGFIGEHAEGAMGLLEVLPQYRRRGLGSQLERAQIAHTLRRGDVPFGQIVVGNVASMALQKSLGMEMSTGTITWVFA